MYQQGAGLGYASEIERISLAYEHDELGVPNSIIAKFPTNAANTRALATLFNLYFLGIYLTNDLFKYSSEVVPAGKGMLNILLCLPFSL